MKRTIYILSVSIMLISMTACGAKNVPKTNDTHSFSETQNTEAQITKEEPNETSMIEIEDTSASTVANESTTLPADESDNTYSLVASVCYPYNNGMDSPEEVIEAYLDAFIKFDSEALYALCNLDEIAVNLVYLKSCLKSEGATDTFVSTHTSSYSLQAGIYYTMMIEAIADGEMGIRFSYPTKSYYYNGEDAYALDYYESFFEEAEAENSDLNSPFIENVYLYDSVGVEDTGGVFYEFMSDDIPVLCIDGKYYLSFNGILGGMEDSGYWLYADVIFDAYEKERFDFEANAYPANVGMDSPEEVANAYIEALKSNNPEAVYALFNTSECKVMGEIKDKWCMESYVANSPLRLTKTECLICLIENAVFEEVQQMDNIHFQEEEGEDYKFFKNLEMEAEVYGVPVPFTPQACQWYSISDDRQTKDSRYHPFCVYSVDDKWYLGASIMDQ